MNSLMRQPLMVEKLVLRLVCASCQISSSLYLHPCVINSRLENHHLRFLSRVFCYLGLAYQIGFKLIWNPRFEKPFLISSIFFLRGCCLPQVKIEEVVTSKKRLKAAWLLNILHPIPHLFRDALESKNGFLQLKKPQTPKIRLKIQLHT